MDGKAQFVAQFAQGGNVAGAVAAQRKVRSDQQRRHAEMACQQFAEFAGRGAGGLVREGVNHTDVDAAVRCQQEPFPRRRQQQMGALRAQYGLSLIHI